MSTVNKNEWFIQDEDSGFNFWKFIANPASRKPCYSLDEVAVLLGISNFSAYLCKTSAIKKLRKELSRKI